VKSFAYCYSFIAIILSFIFALIWFFFTKEWAKVSCFISLFSLIPWEFYFEKEGEN